MVSEMQEWSKPRIREIKSQEKAKGDGRLLRERMDLMGDIVQQETDHALLEFNDANLDKLKEIKSIVIVGPSGAGKSTLVDVMRHYVESSGLGERFAVPKRVVSRPQREKDNLIENEFAGSSEEFEEKTRGGIRWRRKMDLNAGGRIEHYGFVAAPAGAIPVYSANLAILSAEAHLEAPASFLENTLIVYIDARPHILYDRLAQRSPDILKNKPEEAAMRLAGDKEGVREKAHVVLRTRNVERERGLYADTMTILLSEIDKIKR
ncbi:MAG: hypothetical protein JO019_02885 [Candidatus Kaiserbacteria bacterium]|nr:hypothetical protein [Candidatus Kaiserbacteria bacterium]